MAGRAPDTGRLDVARGGCRTYEDEQRRGRTWSCGPLLDVAVETEDVPRTDGVIIKGRPNTISNMAGERPTACTCGTYLQGSNEKAVGFPCWAERSKRKERKRR